MSKPKKKKIPVSIGATKFGKQDISIGITFNKNAMTFNQCDQFLNFHVLSVKLFVEGDQLDLFEKRKAPKPIEGNCEVKGFSSKKKGIGTNLVFKEDDVDPVNVLKYRYKEAMLELNIVGNIEEQKKKSESEDVEGQQEIAV